MNNSLNQKQLAFQKLSREFATKELAPLAAKWDEEKIFPRDVIQKAARQGFCGLYLKEDTGGIHCSRFETTLILEELAKGCTSTAAYISIHNMTAWMIDAFGSEQIRQEWVPKMAAGELLGSYCLTEPWSGSDAAGLKATVKRKGSDWVLNGTKSFVSGAGASDVLVVMARTGEHKTKGISSFVVPANNRGVSYGKNEKKMGWNSQPTRIVNLDNVVIPQDNILGQAEDAESRVGMGFKIAMQGLNGGRINIGSCSIGAAQAALQYSQAYMKQREQFGKKISTFQALRFKLADMATNVTLSRQMIRLAANKLDQKDPKAFVYIAMAKQIATDKCFDVCNQALQIHGGYGYMQDYPIERLMRDTRVHQILEGTNEIMKVIVSQAVLEDNMTYFS